MRVAVAIAAIAFELGCSYRADHADTQYLCSRQGECPESQTCITGVCRQSPMGAVDAAVEPDAEQPFVCPPDCTRVGVVELCYCAAEADFSSGRAVCNAAGLELARPNTPELAEALDAHVSAIGADARGFLGATDLNVEGEWRWLADNELFWTGLADGSAPAGVYTHWADLEPNEFMGNDEDCLNAFETGWNDAQCDQLFAVYCGR